MKVTSEPLSPEILVQSAWSHTWVLSQCESSPGDSTVLQSLRTTAPPGDKISMVFTHCVEPQLAWASAG